MLIGLLRWGLNVIVLFCTKLNCGGYSLIKFVDAKVSKGKKEVGLESC